MNTVPEAWCLQAHFTTTLVAEEPFQGLRMQFGRASALRPRHLFREHDRGIKSETERFQGFLSVEIIRKNMIDYEGEPHMLLIISKRPC